MVEVPGPSTIKVLTPYLADRSFFEAHPIILSKKPFLSPYM